MVLYFLTDSEEPGQLTRDGKHIDSHGDRLRQANRLDEFGIKFQECFCISVQHNILLWPFQEETDMEGKAKVVGRGFYQIRLIRGRKGGGGESKVRFLSDPLFSSIFLHTIQP